MRDVPGTREWVPDLERACGGGGLESVFQPVIDTARGAVTGYEALIRFPGYLEQNPEAWFSAARRHSMAAGLEAAALRSALAHRPSLPANCFLTVNVSPDLLSCPEIRGVWAEEGDLSGLVIELTEQADIDSYRELEPDLNRLRAAGALIAVDDAGSGYAGLQHLLTLRPALIKIDRSLIQNIHADEAKRALVDMLGAFAGRIDAWILAEGIERVEELDTLLTLGVPLAQGYLLGRPSPPWSGLDLELAHRMAAAVRPVPTYTVRDVVEQVPAVAGVEPAVEVFMADPEAREVVLLAEHHRPVAVLKEHAAHLGVLSQGLTVNLETGIPDALARAITRNPPDRFEPLLVTDNAGRYVGIARLERLIDRLTTAPHRKAAPHP